MKLKDKINFTKYFSIFNFLLYIIALFILWYKYNIIADKELILLGIGIIILYLNYLDSANSYLKIKEEYEIMSQDTGLVKEEK